MKILTATSVILLAVVAALAMAGAAHARSPNATHTATATATATATPTPVPSTVTPSPQQVDAFEGQAWLNARVSFGPITAKIGDVICSGPSISITPADSTETLYTVRVLSNDLRQGCGRPGAVVTFFVEGQPAPQTAVWQAGGRQFLSLIAGPPFARLFGTLSIERTSSEPVVPFVNGQACGYDRGGGFVAPETMYEAIVLSNEQQAGCGGEGSSITFKLLDAQGNVIAIAQEKGVWHAWDGVSSLPQLNLTMVPVGGRITVGNVGDGSSQRSDAAPWAEMSLGLSVTGLLGVAIAVALRRRAAAR